MNQSLYFMSTMLTFSCMLPILCPIEYMFCTEMYRFLNYLIYKWESFFVVSVKIIKSKSVPTSAEKKCCTVSTLLDQSQTTYPKPRPFVVLVYIFNLLLYSFSMQMVWLSQSTYWGVFRHEIIVRGLFTGRAI